MAVFYYLLVCVFIKLSLVQCLKWTHHVVLDRDSMFHLLWTPNQDTIMFELQVETHGYVAIGFSPNGGMKGSDIILAKIQNEEIILQDMFAPTNNEQPKLDFQQDVKLIHGYQNDTHTVIAFERKWDTCDNNEDRKLSDDTIRLIYAYNDNDYLVYHGPQRGVRSLHLREPPQNDLNIKNEKLQHWDLKSQVTLPNDDHTHYWCRIFKAPKLDRKHHMVALRPIIQPGNEAYLHHMVLYECHVEKSDDWFEKHVNGAGTACYSPNMPPEWNFCLATNAWAWAVGSEGETLPNHVGMPLGEEYGGATYFLLETHYDNPSIHQNILDSSGIRILYTDQLRQYDTGMLLVGSEVNFLHMIPPEQKSFKTLGRCTSECTEKAIPSTGIHLISGILHSHLFGRKMHLRHIRNGQELPIILQDNSYDFNFQASRQVSKDRGHILPGDELILQCEYGTQGRKNPVFGGLSTREEMCMGFILYYPRSRLADCRSLPTLETVMAAFGIQKVYGKSFEKLAAFLQDLGGRQENDTLQNLLEALASEQNLKKNEGSRRPKGVSESKIPLSEEELLQKPFYTVQEEVVEEPGIEIPDGSAAFSSGIRNSNSQHINLLPSLAEAQSENYRELLPKLLLSVRIKNPTEFRNLTIAERMAMIDWSDPEVGKIVEQTFTLGNHNSLCLAHGREPIIPYSSFPYNPFEKWRETESSQCAIKNTIPQGFRNHSCSIFCCKFNLFFAIFIMLMVFQVR